MPYVIIPIVRGYATIVLSLHMDNYILSCHHSFLKQLIGEKLCLKHGLCGY